MYNFFLHYSSVKRNKFTDFENKFFKDPNLTFMVNDNWTVFRVMFCNWFYVIILILIKVYLLFEYVYMYKSVQYGFVFWWNGFFNFRIWLFTIIVLIYGHWTESFIFCNVLPWSWIWNNVLKLNTVVYIKKPPIASTFTNLHKYFLIILFCEFWKVFTNFHL